MKFLIVDDHPLVLSALSAELGAMSECLLATSLHEGLKVVVDHRDIDLIIYDLSLPDSRGTLGLLRLRTAAQSIPVLVISGSVEPEEIRQAIEFGACGFVPKTTDLTVLRQAIQLVLAGGTYLPSEMIAGLKKDGAQRPLQQSNTIPLTPREKEIASLLALGSSNKAIAAQLGLSENTVRVHVASILKKMNLASRAQVAYKLLLDAG